MNALPQPADLTPHIDQREVPLALLDALKTRFAEQCSTALVVREQHGRDESSFEAPPPAAVVFAESTLDVVDAVKLASQFSVPVIPFAVGPSLAGHLLAVQGGISIDLSRMNQVLAINAEDLTVTVQPGVTRKQLNEAGKSTGLFFPIDPGADATLGGMSATRASGTNAVRYGTMRENVLALDAALAQHNAQLPRLQEFILPAGTRAAALAHVCRTVARRAERAVVALERQEPLKDTPRQYLNRLSDLLFVLARVLNRYRSDGTVGDDVYWKSQRLAQANIE